MVTQNLLRLCPPPRRFNPAGEVLTTNLVKAPSFVSAARKNLTGARAEGVRYENKVFSYIQQHYPTECVLGPWIKFRSVHHKQIHWCQPDAIVLDLLQGVVVVFEIKLKHTSDAWWQLRRLYIPVLQHLFKKENFQFVPVEVCRWFDPHTKFPERFTMTRDFTTMLALSHEDFHVHIWNGRNL